MSGRVFAGVVEDPEDADGDQRERHPEQREVCAWVAFDEVVVSAAWPAATLGTLNLQRGDDRAEREQIAAPPEGMIHGVERSDH